MPLRPIGAIFYTFIGPFEETFVSCYKMSDDSGSKLQFNFLQYLFYYQRRHQAGKWTGIAGSDGWTISLVLLYFLIFEAHKSVPLIYILGQTFFQNQSHMRRSLLPF